MVKQRKYDTKKNDAGKEFRINRAEARKITASTEYETCNEQLSPFGGLLSLFKFLDLVKFDEIFKNAYREPSRKPKLGHRLMVIGILMLLFIGFNRIWHFTYIRLDAMLCGFFRLTKLPVASTFWRYMDSLGINQANSFVIIMRVLRERVWQLCGLVYPRIQISIDTTVETLYGNQQGGRKGHNTKNRGKKGYRPVLCFIDETREYLLGKLRRGDTMGGKETAAFITKIKFQLPGCVKKVLLKADGEFFSWQSVNASIKCGFDFIIANKGSAPPFDPKKWYRPRKRQDIEYNSCTYTPGGWGRECRFVAMRIPKEIKTASGIPVQCELFENDRYTYRIFCTSLCGETHKVIAEYDKRADVENLVGEAKREGLDAIPSSKFKNNYAFFQIVMLAYNIWRYLKMLAQISSQANTEKSGTAAGGLGMKGIMDNTIRIARLKLLVIAGKVVRNSNRDKVKFSIHDSRTFGLLNFLKYLDQKRSEKISWVANSCLKQSFVV